MKKISLLLAISAAYSPIHSQSVSAIELELENSEASAYINGSLSIGQSWRVEEQDLVNNNGINAGDGNNNFSEGPISQTTKLNLEAGYSQGNWGTFVRAMAFYDSVIMNDEYDGLTNLNLNRQNRQATGFSQATKDEAGSDIRVMDAYLYSDFAVGDMDVQMRLGRQVISWGESVFLRDGISSANNPIYATQARLPAVNLKDVFIPLGALSFSVNATENFTIDTYYQFEWEETHLDPNGTYFSTTDVLGDGSNRAIADLTGGAVPNTIDMLAAAGALESSTITAAQRQADNKPEETGQYGIALRFLLESLNQTEISVYHINHHSFNPAITATSGADFSCAMVNPADLNVIGTGQFYNNPAQGPGAVCGQGFAALDGANQSFAGAIAAADGAALAAAGGDLVTAATLQAQAQQLQTDGLAYAEQGLSAIALANALGYLDTTRYQAEFPENLKVWGMSFNTTLGDTSLAGEMVYRENQPIFLDYEDNLLAGAIVGSVRQLEAYGAGLSTNPGLGNGGTANFGYLAGEYGANATVKNFEQTETYNGSLVAISNWGPSTFSDDFLTLIEVGVSHVPDRKPWQSAEGNRLAGIYGGNGLDSDYLTKWAWGYRLAAQAKYNQILAGTNLAVSLRYSNDVKGNAIRGGNFAEGRESGSLAFAFDYLNDWAAELRYTYYDGAIGRNSLSDRDHVAVNLSYSF